MGLFLIELLAIYNQLQIKLSIVPLVQQIQQKSTIMMSSLFLKNLHYMATTTYMDSYLKQVKS